MNKKAVEKITKDLQKQGRRKKRKRNVFLQNKSNGLPKNKWYVYLTIHELADFLSICQAKYEITQDENLAELIKDLHISCGIKGMVLGVRMFFSSLLQGLSYADTLHKH